MSVEMKTLTIGDTTYEIVDEEARNDINELSKKIVPFVTPQMYGAKGDGVTDDTAAFRSALAANNNVFVPEGNYLITEPIDLSNKKSLVGDDSQAATIIYDGNDSVILVGRKTIFRNINITLKNTFAGIVFDTNNYDKTSSTFCLESTVEHSRVHFSTKSTEATVIGITVDSGTDINNKPKLTGICYQNYRDISVGGSSYGYGIKMELIQGRPFTEETKDGFPWLTHVNFKDINLANPYCGIKATVTNTSGSEYFNRIGIGHILFDNVFTQNDGIENTRYFLDVNHFSGFFAKCIGWDYHHTTQDYGEKVNIIGEGAELSFSNCEMRFGVDLLNSCDFIAEKDSTFTVDSSPAYFINKYFNGTFLKNGYDSVDAKIETKLDKAYIGGIAEEVMNDVLYSGYNNVLDDPLTQIKIGYRFSNSSHNWTVSELQTTIVIPIMVGGNIIRWSSSKYRLSVGLYESLFYFNDDGLTSGTYATTIANSDYLDEFNGYIVVDNPNGYKYVSIPFLYYDDISSETMTMTINREITNNAGASYTKYLNDNVITPAVTAEVEKMALASANYTTKVLTVTYEDNTTETVTLVVAK